jgi:hypothetical protein
MAMTFQKPPREHKTEKHPGAAWDFHECSVKIVAPPSVIAPLTAKVCVAPAFFEVLLLAVDTKDILRWDWDPNQPEERILKSISRLARFLQSVQRATDESEIL